MKESPLLTFVVMAYNQEKFIRDAVNGALSQTYSPLEILLSDDCSPDNTFDIMQKMASNYRGPHRIVLNRNTANLGPGGHFNRIVDLASGELVVYSEGDDISLPERTKIVYEAWESSGQAVSAIYSDYILIDKSGVQRDFKGQQNPKTHLSPEILRGDLREFLTTWSPMICGCTMAWSKSIFREFGHVPADLRYVDLILSFRSLGSNGILHIHSPLIKYRRHDNNFSYHNCDDVLDQKTLEAYDAKQKIALQGFAAAYEVMIHDIDTLRRIGGHDRQYLGKLEHEARRVQLLYLFERQMISDPFPSRLSALRKILAHGGVGTALKWTPQLLSRRAYHKARSIKKLFLPYL